MLMNIKKLERLEKNVSDLQKGKFDSLDSSLSSGYIFQEMKKELMNLRLI